MGVFDPLKPYLTLIKWVLGVGLLFAAFASGCSWKGDRDEKEMGEMQQTIDAQLLQLNSLTSTLESVNEQTAENMKVAEEARKLAQKAVDEAENAKGKLDKQQADWNKKFADAQRNPNCKELMEKKLCPLIQDF